MSLVKNHICEVRKIVKEWKAKGLTIGVVPTMGALHKGHASLMKKARELCDKVIVTVFVNPTQFGPNEDYDKYPRTLESDKKLCEGENVDLIFAPAPLEMYPEENFTKVVPPEVFQNKLCGKSRPVHFNGVALVVTKLFNITQADYGFFGLKDAQQFFIIKKFVRDLNIPIEIIGCPIIREDDGLAVSSRNIYLDEDARLKAPCLSRILSYIKKSYDEGERDFDKIKAKSLELLEEGIEIEYLENIDTETFEQVSALKENTLVALAAKIAGVRLIDNVIF